MGKIAHAFESAMEFLRDMHRYAQGGHPVPAALDALSEFLSRREDLSPEAWVSEVVRNVSVSRDVAVFAHDFFASFNVPAGKIRSGDRVSEDLHLNHALQDDWDEELVDEFKKRFKKNLAFATWPRIETVADLLLFLQQVTEQGG